MLNWLTRHLNKSRNFFNLHQQQQQHFVWILKQIKFNNCWNQPDKIGIKKNNFFFVFHVYIIVQHYGYKNTFSPTSVCDIFLFIVKIISEQCGKKELFCFNNRFIFWSIYKPWKICNVDFLVIMTCCTILILDWNSLNDLPKLYTYELPFRV